MVETNDEICPSSMDALVGRAKDCSGYDVAYEDIRELQIAAMNQRLQHQIDKIKPVRFRTEDACMNEISRLEDVVPLLLPHTVLLRAKLR